MVRIPAFCLRCENVFESFINLESGGKAIFDKVMINDICPKCGGPGHIPNGIYEGIDNAIRFLANSVTTTNELNKLKEILQVAEREAYEPNVIVETIREEAPSQAELANFLFKEKDRKETFRFYLLLLLAIITAIQGLPGALNETDALIKRLSSEKQNFIQEATRKCNSASSTAKRTKQLPKTSPKGFKTLPKKTKK